MSLSKQEKQQALKKLSIKEPVHFCAVGFGTGLSPVMPGTVGTFAAIPFLALFPFLPIWAQVMLAFFVAFVGIWICDKAAWDMKVHDHPAIVWDEIAGMLITMVAVPFSAITLVAGFLLFRFFDIVKPWPISFFDKKVKGGLGIMLDDIVAGLLALACLQLALNLGWLPS